MKFLFSLLFISFFTLNISISQNTISGKVTDESGAALPGVSVLEKGTSNGTMTIKDGTYSIKVNSKSKYLVFSYIGMKTIEKKITSDTLNLIMSVSEEELDEVVVTSLGISKIKKAFGYDTRSDRPSAEYETYDYATVKRDKTESNKRTVKSGLLTAGELNDYGKWELWKDISENQLKTFKSVWNMMPQHRYCVQVTNYKDKPIVNAKVFLQTKKGDTIWAASTDNTGKAELWLNVLNETYSDKDLYINITDMGQSYKLLKPDKFHDGINFISIPAECYVPEKADIAFVVDATGSMGDEIAYLKAELEDVLNKIQKQHKDITVNTASVFYRDIHDSYLTQKSDFSKDIKQTIQFINKQSAGGGGDFPEAADAGLNTAINELNWSEDALTKVVFLILDAPPHSDAESVKKMQKLTKEAAAKGIRIVPVTASGIDKSTEYLMRSIALATNGTYVFLTDDSGIGNAHIKPTTDEYQVEFLNDVFIRLINQYLSIPDCEEDIVYNKEEIQDTSYIADNSIPQDTSAVDTTDATHIDNTVIPGKVKYYPNPTIDILNIEFSGDMKEMFLADVSGKILQRFDIQRKNSFRISLSKYPSGIYFIQYQNGERWQTGKIIHTKL
ncbi:MAG: hypothetical protein DRI94_01665 [Bacteroidetes bacterium]|nr:MAG: hypothetical protein DRI94_01665 [Bacteroidota bacterium]